MGSTMMKRTSSGVDLYSRLMMRELVHTDLPEPVVPAISAWGSRAMSPMTLLPPISRPRAKATADLCSVKSRDSMTSRISTGVTALLGTSMPTTEILSGMGAMRTPVAPRARAMSSARLVILESFTPWSSTNSYRVTEGPWTTSPGVASTPKLFRVSARRRALFRSSAPAST